MSGPVKIKGTFEIKVTDGVPSMRCEVFVDDSTYQTNKGFLDDLNGVMMGLKTEFGNAICDHAFPEKQRPMTVAFLLTGSLFRKFGPTADFTSEEAVAHMHAWFQRKGLGALLCKAKKRSDVSLLQALMELPEIREPYGDVLDKQAGLNSPPKVKSRMPNYGDN